MNKSVCHIDWFCHHVEYILETNNAANCDF